MVAFIIGVFWGCRYVCKEYISNDTGPEENQFGRREQDRQFYVLG